MKNPCISIIIPCYNQAQYLEKCLQSVLNQTYTNWECIIINDGSSDNTQEVALDWSKKDERYEYLYKENGGVSSARNFGIENAKGKYIVFVDADDTVDEIFLETYIIHIDKDLEFIVQDFNRINTKGKFNNFLGYEDTVFCLSKPSQLNQLKYFEGYVCNKLYKREILNNYNIRFDNSLTLCEDLKFYLEYIEYIEKIKFVKNSTYNYFYRSESATNSFHEHNNFIEIFKNYNKIFKNNKFISKKEIQQKYTYLFIMFLSSMNKKEDSERVQFLKKVYSVVNFDLISSTKYRYILFKNLYFLKLYHCLIFAFSRLSK